MLWLHCGTRCIDGLLPKQKPQTSTTQAFPHASPPPGAIMAVLWFGARQVLEGRLTAGRLSAFVVYAVFVAANAGMLMGVFSQVMQVGRCCLRAWGFGAGRVLLARRAQAMQPCVSQVSILLHGFRAFQSVKFHRISDGSSNQVRLRP